MAEAEQQISEPVGADRAPRAWHARWRWRVSGLFLLVLAALLAWVWGSRERLADDLITGQLEQYDLPASYDIEQISAGQQVLANIVIGDPQSPDMVIERAEVELTYGFGGPSIGKVRLVRPRLFGRLEDGKVSFGSLDKVIYAESDVPPALPDIDLTLEDGRALVDSEYGPVGIKAEGAGNLASGFVGIIAANAPSLAGQGCVLRKTTLYGSVKTKGGEPHFAGPLRMGGVSCEGGIQLDSSAMELAAHADKDFTAFEASGVLDGGKARFGTARLAGSDGTIRAAWRDGRLNSTWKLAARLINLPQAKLAKLSGEGTLRASDGFSQIGAEAELEGEGFALGRELDATLASVQDSSVDTLAAPLLAKIRSELAREATGSRLAASLSLRTTPESTSLVMPQARWRGGSGETLLALSSFQLASDGGAPLVSGNLSTGGGLPRITGRMEQGGGGRMVLNLAMAPYEEGAASLAMPRMVLLQDRRGTLGFSGEVIASGPLPGGEAQGLRMPLVGSWSPDGKLAIARACTNVAFDNLQLAQLTLQKRALTLCPPRGRSILEMDGRGMRLAAGAPSLAIDGLLGETPLKVKSGPIGFAWPGALYAKDANVQLGPADSGVNLRLADLDATLGSEIAGTFSGVEAQLAAVPMDISEATGKWAFADGALRLSETQFRLSDREFVPGTKEPRFYPLTASEAALELADNVIRADAVMRNPATLREVVRADIRHDLLTTRGEARLAVDGLRFDDQLEFGDVSYYLFGFVAYAEGIVSGQGRINWDENGVTSSGGTFGSDDFKLAAAFGTVGGLRGQVQFTDLISLTTAPRQKLYIASIDPGIEARDGEIEWSLVNGEVLEVHGGQWPFLGGRLELRPVTLNFSQPETRRYVLDIAGVEAAQFIEQMELANLSATGQFDGTLPLVFDEMGNGSIEGGALVSRPPGGNLSYVGELTYEDMGAMANFAFKALRSLNYRQMTIDMQGPLTGEIITQMRFDGVTQGEGASRNILTRRIAKLPIRFNINIRTSFYKLFRDIQMIYDPAMSANPMALGLVDAQGNPIRQTNPEGAIQTPESEDRP
ncbi:MAG: YdbH domain-containing protein [Sphingomonadaceae bacterium]|nr:YdbH domain-containing protein [Sphingomonadaceae bacterium]